MNVPNRNIYITGFILTFIGAVLFSTKAIFVKLAFAKPNAMIISVTCDDDKVYTIKYLQDGEQKKFSFDMKTGAEL